MKIKRRQILAGAATLLVAGCGSSDQSILNPAAAQTTTSTPTTGSRLFVLDVQGGSQVGDRLIFTGVASDIVYFDDRPARGAGRQSTGQFVANWGASGFAAVPPNAVLQIDTASRVFELQDPQYDAASNTLSFQVTHETGAGGGATPSTFGAAVLFIDPSNSTGTTASLVLNLASTAPQGLSGTCLLQFNGDAGQPQVVVANLQAVSDVRMKQAVDSLDIETFRTATVSVTIQAPPGTTTITMVPVASLITLSYTDAALPLSVQNPNVFSWPSLTLKS